MPSHEWFFPPPAWQRASTGGHRFLGLRPGPKPTPAPANFPIYHFQASVTSAQTNCFYRPLGGHPFDILITSMPASHRGSFWRRETTILEAFFSGFWIFFYFGGGSVIFFQSIWILTLGRYNKQKIAFCLPPVPQIVQVIAISLLGSLEAAFFSEFFKIRFSPWMGGNQRTQNKPLGLLLPAWLPRPLCDLFLKKVNYYFLFVLLFVFLCFVWPWPKPC